MEIGVSDDLPSSCVMHRNDPAVPEVQNITSIQLQEE